MVASPEPNEPTQPQEGDGPENEAEEAAPPGAASAEVPDGAHHYAGPPDEGARAGAEVLGPESYGVREPATGSRTCPLCSRPIAPGSRLRGHPQGTAHYVCPR